MEKLKFLLVLGLMLASVLQAAPTYISDDVVVDGHLLTTIIGPYNDSVDWSHDNPFWDVGNYEASINDGILGVDLIVDAADICAWDDEVTLSFTDKAGITHDLGSVTQGTNAYTIDKTWLDGVEVEATLHFSYDHFLDLLDYSRILTSSLVVYYDSDLIVSNQSASVIANPAPGAVLLGSVGLMIVGWLRNRKILV